MSDNVYKIIELTGSSKTGIEAAVDNAVSKAAETLEDMRWLEVGNIRGEIEGGRIAYWQVTVKIGFNVSSPKKSQGAQGEKSDKSEGGKSKSEEAKSSAKKGSGKYRCTVCGYIYDPEKGDPDHGVSAGTPFEELPDDWHCPDCGVDKSKFEKI